MIHKILAGAMSLALLSVAGAFLGEEAVPAVTPQITVSAAEQETADASADTSLEELLAALSAGIDALNGEIAAMEQEEAADASADTGADTKTADAGSNAPAADASSGATAKAEAPAVQTPDASSGATADTQAAESALDAGKKAGSSKNVQKQNNRNSGAGIQSRTGGSTRNGAKYGLKNGTGHGITGTDQQTSAMTEQQAAAAERRQQRAEERQQRTELRKKLNDLLSALENSPRLTDAQKAEALSKVREIRQTYGQELEKYRREQQALAMTEILAAIEGYLSPAA